ncbi:GLPGLI family protein [Elizabethkingia anophelis]|uniref:GLPGLI family protein n=1 Tax=Elizabethkingia anophelis TaxID=1117645 RepID=UPI0013680AE0|nr:GLPGLI family protein [Elizabethkingia anophelis]MCT4324756.1 GLPGLI family protein [Elizabethkingia anophelis]MYY24491.1 GLPGLI family protein [Elizabethkingia anophelis]
MNKIILLLCFLPLFLSAQNYHVEYINRNSPLTRFKEDLYIQKDNFISIRDSVVIRDTEKIKQLQEGTGNGFGFFTKDKLHTVIYYKNNKNNNVIIRDYIKDQVYFIKDEIPLIRWNTDYPMTKIIAGYKCNKATTIFRGSKIVAYYTKSINIKTGPYKFNGLPGLILEVYEENSDVNLWTATKVEPLSASFSGMVIPSGVNIISLKSFNDRMQKKNDEDFEKIMETVPKGVEIKRNKTERKGIEKKYEWE